MSYCAQDAFYRTESNLDKWSQRLPVSGDRIQVSGCEQHGFRLTRSVSFEACLEDRYGLPFEPIFNAWPVGDAGAVFRDRSAAEAYGQRVVQDAQWGRPLEQADPGSFGGADDVTTAEAQEQQRIFFEGAFEIDPRAGWDELDPEGLLDGLPSCDDPFEERHASAHEVMESLHSVDGIPSRRDRAIAIRNVVQAGLEFYRGEALVFLVDEPLDEAIVMLAGEAEEQPAPWSGDYGYIALLLLRDLRHQGPRHWFFRDHPDDLRAAVQVMMDGLDTDARAAIARRQANAGN